MDAILFDLDDTLCTYRRHGREVLAAAFEQVGVDPAFTIEEYYGVYEEYVDVADTVDAQRAACFEALAETAGVEPSVGRAVARAYAKDRDHRDVVFLDGARESLESLATEYRIGLVTNGAPDMQALKLEALGIREAFETIVHGGHDAPAKPSPEPFSVALDALGVEPERAVHVGNSLEADIGGAKAAGLRAVWLRDGDTTPTYEPRPDDIIDSLVALASLPWAR